MTEILDIFDGNHNPIGSFERVAAHQQGLWHQTFHCWIVNSREGQEPRLVLQLRAAEKKNYPNMLDISAAGHLSAGESPTDGLRELSEELGVEVEPEKLVYLGVKHDVMDEPSGVRNREFSHVYLLRDDRDLADYRLQPDEVSGLMEVSLQSGLKLFSGEVASIRGDAIRVDAHGDAEEFERELKVEDLIPRVDPYYLKIFIMADLYLRGYPYLSA